MNDLEIYVASFIKEKKKVFYEKRGNVIAISEAIKECQP